jgi:hypothetical protein
MTRWMIVSSVENFEATAGLQFTIQGLKSRHRKKAQRMEPGDSLAYYLTGVGCFAATCEVTSQYFEGRDTIWRAKKKPEEVYPWRVEIAPRIVVAESARIPASQLKDQLTFVRKWPEEHWRLAFQGMVHVLPECDWQTIECALENSTVITEPAT